MSRYAGRMTVTRGAVANGDFRVIHDMLARVRERAPADTVWVVVPSSPANEWFRVSDAVDVLAVSPDRLDAELILHVHAMGDAEPARTLRAPRVTRGEFAAALAEAREIGRREGARDDEPDEGVWQEFRARVLGEWDEALRER